MFFIGVFLGLVLSFVFCSFFLHLLFEQRIAVARMLKEKMTQNPA